MTASCQDDIDIGRAVEVLARHWPRPGDGRHNAYLALAGGLVRNDVPDDTIKELVRQLVRATRDEDGEDARLANVASTRKKKEGGEQYTGWLALINRIGPEPVLRAKIALDLAVTIDVLAEEKKLPRDYLEGLGVHDLSTGHVGIPYRDAAGRTVAMRRRISLRRKPRVKWELGAKVAVYGEDHLEFAVRLERLTLVEGESDCWTLWHHGEPALGIPGVETVEKTLQAGHVSCAKVVHVVQEPGQPGERFVEKVRRRLLALGWQGNLYVIKLGEAKDPSGLHCLDPQGFGRAWQEAFKAATPVGRLSASDSQSPRKMPRLLPSYEPFPVEVLPEPLATFVRHGSEALRCDPAFFALPILATVAAAVGNARVIRLRGGSFAWDEPCLVWAVIIADSGTLKSPAYLAVVRPLFGHQRRLLEKFKQAIAQHRKDMAAYRKAKDEGREADEPDEPVLQRVVCSDTTIEKLAEILEDNERGILVARDELAAWLGSFTRYKGKQGGSDLPHWLEISRAGTILYDRKTGDRRTIFVSRAAASITGGIQPKVLTRSLVSEFFDAGLPARLLMAMPTPPMDKRWSEVEVAPDVAQAYEAILGELLKLSMDEDDGERVPHKLCLSREGKQAWGEFYNQWAREQAGVSGELAAAFSKLEGYAARLALVHHVVTHVARGESDLVPIGPESVLAGATLCRWFAREAERVYLMFALTRDEWDTSELVELIRKRGGRITTRELMRSKPRQYPDANAAEKALASLVDAGLARWISPATTMMGGKGIKAVELPTNSRHVDTVDTADTDSEPDEADETGGVDTASNAPDTGSPYSTSSGAAENRRTAFKAKACDTNAGNGQTPREVTGVSGVSGVNVSTNRVEGGGESGSTEPQEAGPESGVNNPGSGGHTFAAPGNGRAASYRLVTDPGELPAVAQAVQASATVGLDIETTGLDPRKDRVRLLQLGTDRGAWLVDCFQVDPSPLWDALGDAERTLLGANLMFDLPFLHHRHGFTHRGRLLDMVLLSRLLTAGGPDRHDNALEDLAARHLGITLDKAYQRGGCWEGELTAGHLRYAAQDVALLPQLLAKLLDALDDAGLKKVAGVEMDALPAWVWLACSGAPVDRQAWQQQAQQAEERLAVAHEESIALAPKRQGELPGLVSWNWNKQADVLEALKMLGMEPASTQDEALAALDHPFAEALRRYRSAAFHVSHYGQEALRWVAEDSRIYAAWNPLGNDAGRSSCKKPNLQGLGKDATLRRCFAAPASRVLVKADWSQLHLRIVARMAGEQVMLDAYRRGDDLHRIMARKITGKQEVTKEERQLAKAVNFGLLYGMSAPGLMGYARASYGVTMTLAQAQQARGAFFGLYPAIGRWHQQTRSKNAPETRSLCGRRRLFGVKAWLGDRLNSPVLGTEADALKRALALLWERRDQVPGAFPVLAVHDEIVVECGAEQGDACAAWLKQAMIDAMQPLIDPVPVEVETTIARTWGG